MGVHLVDVGKPLGENITGHLVAKLVSEFRGLTTGTGDKGTGVGDGTSHDTSDIWGEVEDVGDGCRVDELVLCVGLALSLGGCIIGSICGMEEGE